MNVYYSPQDAGLTLVAECDPDEPYQFDTVILVRHDDTGKLYAAHDAGCSCPTPFDDHAFPADFVEVRQPEDVRPLLEQQYGLSATDALDFMAEVRKALR